MTIIKAFKVKNKYALSEDELSAIILEEAGDIKYDRVSECRMIIDPNLEKIDLSYSQPDSILWERHWLFILNGKTVKIITAEEIMVRI